MTGDWSKARLTRSSVLRTCSMTRTETSWVSLPKATLTIAVEMLPGAILNGGGLDPCVCRRISWAVSKVMNKLWSRSLPVGSSWPVSFRS